MNDGRVDAGPVHERAAVPLENPSECAAHTSLPRIRLTPEAFVKPVGGVRRSAFDLLAALRGIGADVSVSPQVEKLREQDAPSSCTRAALQLRETCFFARERWSIGEGVAHSLYYDQHVRPGHSPLVVTVHDMVHERFGAGGRALRQAKRFSVRRASLVITPSRATAADVAAAYPRMRAPIVTVPWAVSDVFLAERGTAEDRFGQTEDDPFLLYVGRRNGYKNFELLRHALSIEPALRRFRVVLVGGESLDDVERRHLAWRLGATAPVLHLGSVGDAELRVLYESAAALVVTSRCEGFGLPVLEAMAVGCPVACSRGGSLAEVADGHASTFSPDSATECAEAILTATGLPDVVRRAARAHATSSTWSDCAAAHLDAYRTVEL